ncbi:hypothetical protein KI387_037448, partial [Taxus chinensis]
EVAGSIPLCSDRMAVASRVNGSSTLNPNAPLFIPLAYQQVEDFSTEWWKLVQSSPWFRDYWIRERYETFDEAECFADLFPETLEDPDEEDEFSELEEALLHCSEVYDGEYNDAVDYELERHAADVNEKDLLLAKTSNNGKPSKPKYEVKCCEKPPQIVSVKTSPRRIQQPR